MQHTTYRTVPKPTWPTMTTQLRHVDYTASRKWRLTNIVDQSILVASEWPIVASAAFAFAMAPISLMLHRAYVDTGYTLQQPLGVFDIMFGIYISSLIIVSIQNKLYVVIAAAATIEAAEEKVAMFTSENMRKTTYPNSWDSNAQQHTLAELIYTNEKFPQPAAREYILAKIDAFHSVDAIMRVKTENSMRSTALYLLLIYHLAIQPIFSDQSLDFTSNLFNRAAIILIHTILLLVVYKADSEAHKHAASVYLYHGFAQNMMRQRK